MKRYDRSAALLERARKSLAGGVSSEFRKFNAPHALVFTHAQGCRMVDADENEYIDFTLSQGPMILGHGNREVLERVHQASVEGQLFAALHMGEVELAERLQAIVPSAELVRFSVSGSEADHAALRAARGVTGRNKFIRFEGHYHGWLDNVSHGIGGPTLESLGPREAPHALPWSQGLPPSDESILLPWNDLALVERTLRDHGHDVAAIITEPIMCNSGCIEPAPGYLQGLRELCDQHGCALIFDEVITGFRIHVGGAQAYYGVTPDLSVFAKAMANGYPIAALVGKRKWMEPIAEGRVIHAGTLNASNATVAAALATLDVMQRDNVQAHLHAMGRRAINGLRDTACKSGHDVLVQGPGPMFHFGFTKMAATRDLRDTFAYDKAKGAKFVLEMQERGIRLIGRGLWYISAAHSVGDIDAAIDAAADVLSHLPH